MVPMAKRSGFPLLRSVLLCRSTSWGSRGRVGVFVIFLADFFKDGRDIPPSCATEGESVSGGCVFGSGSGVAGALCFRSRSMFWV